MKYLNLFSGATRELIIATTAFLLYGYLCRLFGIYFFWESKSIGWVLFWVMIIEMLRQRIRGKQDRNEKILLEKIGIGFCVFIILFKGIFFFAVKQTSAYEHAINFIKTNNEIQSEVGEVNGIFLVPFGSMTSSTSSQSSVGQADLHFIVKGAKKYADLDLSMNKESNRDWQIKLSQ